MDKTTRKESSGMARFLISLFFSLVLFVALAPLGAQETRYPMQKRELPDFMYFYWEANLNVGYQFKCTTAGMQVTELGCVTYDGNPRIVTLFDCGTREIVAQATTGTCPRWSWRWVTLDQPVMLKKDRLYCVTQYTGNDEYYVEINLFDTPEWRPTADVEFIRSVTTSLPGDPNTYPSGTLGSSYIDGVADFGYRIVPDLEVTADIGQKQVVYPAEQGPGGNGFVAGAFSIASVGAPQNGTLESISVRASGTGHDALDFSQVSIYRDVNADARLDAGDEFACPGFQNFGADNGTAQLALVEGQRVFAANERRYYLIVVRLSGSAEKGDTFQFEVAALLTTPDTGCSGAPSETMEGLETTDQPFEVIDYTPASQAEAPADESEFLMQDFSLRLAFGPQRKVQDLTFYAYGSGQDAADYVSVQLYRDADRSGRYDPLTDLLIGSAPGFSSDNGFIRFTFPETEPMFGPGDSWRFFLVVRLSFSAPDGATYQTRLVDGMELTADIGFMGIPAPAAGPAAGVLCINHNLVTRLNGPLTPETIANNSMGVDRRGHMLCDVTLSSYGAQWILTALKFRASGSGNDATAFSSLMLIEDDNANGVYDGIPQDMFATLTSPLAFPEDNGVYSAELKQPVFLPGQSRRFFLVAMFIGTAETGDTFNVALEDVAGAFPEDSLFRPGQTSAGPVIDLPTITVGLGSGSPGDSSRETGADFSYVLAKFRFTVAGAPATLSGLHFTSRGSADMATDLRGGNGIEAWLDNGNGVFEGGDTQLCSANGGTPMSHLPFDAPVEIPGGTTRDIWIVLNVVAWAGGSVPDTFQLALEYPADVDAGGGYVFFPMEQAVVSNTLSVVMFAVEQLTPQLGSGNGGEAIVVRGSGFSLPAKLSIGGKACPGHAVVTADGRQITGLFVPPGQGRNLEVTLKTGGLEEKKLPMAFSYNEGDIITAFDHTSTCSVGAGALPVVAVVMLALLAAVRLLRVRRAARVWIDA
ncbi:MAG: IPT/TIG domain-containing protein [Planctomycetes bacterium]|nr:IPT/TIG domain-containing protein [Planctomycetota bacterium]